MCCWQENWLGLKQTGITQITTSRDGTVLNKTHSASSMTDAWNEDDTKEASKNLQNSDVVPETTTVPVPTPTIATDASTKIHKKSKR